MHNSVVRPIEPKDNPRVEHIIHSVMTEYQANGDGFAITDPSVKDMHRFYSKPRSIYYVVEVDHQVCGGAGIAPLEGGEFDVCELQKMYFLPEIRGRGLAKQLLELCLTFARGQSFSTCYIETLSHMTEAISLYEKFGFQSLEKPMGDTGHFGCNSWLSKGLRS